MTSRSPLSLAHGGLARAAARETGKSRAKALGAKARRALRAPPGKGGGSARGEAAFPSPPGPGGSEQPFSVGRALPAERVHRDPSAVKPASRGAAQDTGSGVSANPLPHAFYRSGWSLAQMRVASFMDPESLGWTPS